jgi:hypothetical protein
MRWHAPKWRAGPAVTVCRDQPRGAVVASRIGWIVGTWRLGNLSTPNGVQKLQKALHAKAKAEAGRARGSAPDLMALNPSAQNRADGSRAPQGPKETVPPLRLDQQSYEADKQRATEDHGPVPYIKTEKPAIGRHKFELHERPLLGICSQSSLGGRSLRNGSAHSAVLLLPAQKFENVIISCIRRRGGHSDGGAPIGYCESLR